MRGSPRIRNRKTTDPMSREFMDEFDLPPSHEAEREVCRDLRTRIAFGHLVGHRPWQSGDPRPRYAGV